MKHQIREEHEESRNNIAKVLFEVKKRVGHIKKRASVPEWPLPAVISQVILQPTEIARGKPPTAGRGFNDELIEAPHRRGMFRGSYRPGPQGRLRPIGCTS
eukprot:557726-Pyramimonas_sp.AAC.1